MKCYLKNEAFGNSEEFKNNRRFVSLAFTI